MYQKKRSHVLFSDKLKTPKTEQNQNILEKI